MNGNDRLLSLFCGAGGLDLGFEMAGFTTGLAVDSNKTCVDTYNANRTDKVAHVGDVSTLSVEDLDEMYGGEFSPLGVIGGPPCQSFSVSNVHKKEDDPRSDLPGHYAKLIARLNKRSPIHFFLFENVPGLLNSQHKAKFDAMVDVLSDHRFVVTAALLNARYYGVPQDRQRLFVVGINEALYEYPEWRRPDPLSTELTVRDVLSGLPEPIYNKRNLDPMDIPYHPNHWCLVPRSGKFSDGSLTEGKASTRSFRVLNWDKPSWTVAYGNREVHIHPNGHRRLSVWEAMVLQSFPFYYRMLGNISEQYSMVSDAVPPKLAGHIAISLRETIDWSYVHGILFKRNRGRAL